MENQPIHLPVSKRAECEDGLARYLMEQAVSAIPRTFPPWARQQIETCIRQHEIRSTCSNQRTYRCGIDGRMKRGLRPDYLSIHTIRCIYFKHQPVIIRRLAAAGFDWMLRTDVIWDEYGRRLKNPATPNGPWIAVTPPEMPDQFRRRNTERFRRERPVYTVHGDNTITVAQVSILPDEFPATRQEMEDCDDRIEQLADGTVQYTGPLRPLHRAQQHRAAQDENAEVEVGGERQVQSPQAQAPQEQEASAGVAQPSQQHTIDRLGEHGLERLDPVELWSQQYLLPKHILAQRTSSSHQETLNVATSTTPSDQERREEKCAPYEDPWYTLLLRAKNSYMERSSLGITDASTSLCQVLLDHEQPVPKESLFDHDIFEDVCGRVGNRNQARIVQDISRLIVPSAEMLAFRIKNLESLVESVNEGWNNSIPLTGTHPQPDYAVGFKLEAFSKNQLGKLSPFIGDVFTGDQSFFKATYYMYFPFLSCEVGCGSTSLDIADRKNAHSMTLAVRAVVELFRAVNRADVVHRQILAFSISHDHQAVRIYGHYAVIGGDDVKYYRHPIRKFDLTELNGRDKWTSYKFTRNVYELWVPAHLKRISSAIDQLPSKSAMR